MWTETRVVGRNKVTKSDLNPYLTELNGHKIGDCYVAEEPSRWYQLVLIDNVGHIVLVDSLGVGKTSNIATLQGYPRLESGSEHFDWLTWRASDTNKTYKHGPLSSFWIEPDGKSLEHRFASLKTTDFHKKFNILVQPTPGLAKKAGRRVPLRPDWDEIKRDLMWDLLVKKFYSDAFAQQYLLATRDLIIREKNDWNDTIWGVNHNNQGQNLLGQGLMYVRQVLQEIESLPKEL